MAAHEEKFKPTQKLCPDLKDKKKYVCSLLNLQLFLDNGLELEKIHKILVSKQDNFMARFIDFNSRRRLEARSKFEQDFFKLMNNRCVFFTDLQKLWFNDYLINTTSQSSNCMIH